MKEGLCGQAQGWAFYCFSSASSKCLVPCFLVLSAILASVMDSTKKNRTLSWELKIEIVILSLNSGTPKKQAAPCCSLYLFALLNFRGRNSQAVSKEYKAKLPFIQNTLGRNLCDVCGFSFDNQVNLFHLVQHGLPLYKLF